MNDNPYQSPVDDEEPKTDRPRRFRWRVLLFALMILLPIFYLLSGIIALLYLPLQR